MDDVLIIIEDLMKNALAVVFIGWLLIAPIISINYMINGTDRKWLRRFAQTTFLIELFFVWANVVAS